MLMDPRTAPGIPLYLTGTCHICGNVSQSRREVEDETRGLVLACTICASSRSPDPLPM